MADGFCCRGCETVFHLIESEGLERFYDLRGAPIAPVGGRVFEPLACEWLREAAAAAEGDGRGGPAHLRVQIGGISCLACIWLLERLFEQQEAALRIDVHPARGRAELSWEPGGFDAAAFAAEIARYGYTVAPATEETASEADAAGRRLGICGALALNTMGFTLPRYLGMPETFFLASTFELIAATSATIAFLVGGSYFFSRAVAGLRHGILHIDTPIALGLLAAFLGSLLGWMAGLDSLLYFDFVAVFVFLMLAGRYLQTAALEANRRRLPATEPGESVLAGAGENAGPLRARELEAGARYRLQPGQVVPVSSRLSGSGAREFSTESINGESRPRQVAGGGTIPAGARSIGRDAIEAVALQGWEDSLFRRLSEAASTSTRNRGQERLIAAYLGLVILVALAGFAWWWRAGDLVHALQVMISVFVVSCPCALGVALPLADEFAARRMAGRGVFIRSGHLWARLRTVRAVVFDKTGTLTGDLPVLENPAALERLDPGARRTLARMVASSYHPISRSLASELAARLSGEVPRGPLPGCREVAGEGLFHTDPAGVEWSLTGDRREGRCLFRRGATVLAGFSFADRLRPGAAGTVASLARRGLDSVILSGDAPGKVAPVAEALGLPPTCARGGMSPTGKEAWVRATDRPCLFLGDGANDSLAAAAARCSGAMVSEDQLLQQKADFFVFGQHLAFLPVLFETARLRSRAVLAAFLLAVVYNLLALGSALAGWMNPLLAAVLMPASSILIISVVGAAFRFHGVTASVTPPRRERKGSPAGRPLRQSGNPGATALTEP